MLETHKMIAIPGGETVSILGQGTWQMGEDPRHRSMEVNAIRLGMDLGMTLIDTAEMYADGGAEQIVGEAIQGRRDKAFIVSKCYPHHADTASMRQACEASLKRLGTDRIDLYLLHWRGSIPLEETVRGFEALRAAGKIRFWGVSNFDTEDMQSLWKLSQGQHVATNQVLYNLKRRNAEWDLLSWCQQHHIPVMAYSPIEQGALSTHRAIRQIAEQHRVSAAQIALAWVLAQNNVIAIPKSSNPQHVRENWNALEIRLTDTEFQELERAFPAPSKPVRLESI